MFRKIGDWDALAERSKNRIPEVELAAKRRVIMAYQTVEEPVR
jgi:hypothetical protein